MGVQEGATVVITGTDQARIEAAARRLNPDGRVIGVAADAGDPDAVERLFDRIEGLPHPLAGAFANAGRGAFGPIARESAEDSDAMFRTNTRGVFLTLKRALAAVRPPRAIVVNASWTAHRGLPDGALYAATKGALVAMVQVLARQHGRRGIRVNSVSPGTIQTPAVEQLGLSGREAAFWNGQVPLGRFGLADEVAAAVAFLLSDGASYISEADLLIDGGLTRTLARPEFQ